MNTINAMKMIKTNKRIKPSLFIGFLCLMLLVLAACGDSSSGIDGNGKPTGSVALKDAPADLQTVYKSNCMSCHAIDLSGKMGESTNLQQVHARLSYEEIVDKLNNGGRTMPSFQDRLSIEEIEGLAGWLAKQ